jgi:hypothetical protein
MILESDIKDGYILVFPGPSALSFYGLIEELDFSPAVITSACEGCFLGVSAPFVAEYEHEHRSCKERRDEKGNWCHQNPLAQFDVLGSKYEWWYCQTLVPRVLGDD